MMDTTDTQDRTQLLAMAQRASETLARSVADKSDERPIETNVASLRGLAEVIGLLVSDAGRCGGTDCMGRAVDGIKLWVTRDRHELVEARCSRYEAALRTIAGAVGQGDGELDMLIDWQGTAHALAKAARTALSEAPGGMPARAPADR